MTRRYSLQRAQGQTSKISYEKELNPEQLRAVTSKGGPTLVLAGPGSGKTRTLTYRVAYLLEQGIDPRRILLVTFTVKAARQMLERVEKILRNRPDGLWGGTFHHIGNLLLRQHAELIRRSPAFGILDEEDAKDMISACMADLKLPLTKTRFPQANVLKTLFSHADNTLRPIEQLVSDLYPQFCDQLPALQQVAESYRKRKEQANVLDYDDLLTLWLRLLKENPTLSKLYGEQFQYILVDEYQDTNRLQFEIIRNMASHHRNLLVVGDDAQSIYAFRGAEVENLLTFPDVFPGTTIFRLETNYRSTPEILRLANASIQLNSRQFPKELKSVQPPGPLPAVVPLVDLRQQAAFIAQRVLELREEGVPLQEIAVLFRARFQAAEMELELAKRNIPYVVRGGIRFFEQAHIKDLLAHLRILVNPRDEMAWDRTLRLQEGIGPAYARRIWETLTDSPNPLEKARGGETGNKALPSRAAAAWSRLRKILRDLSAAQKADQPAEALAVVVRSGYQATLEARFEDARARKEDLDQLINLASNYVSISKFIEDLTLREPFKGESIQGWENPDEFLALSTIHQAKGLEWTALFLIGLVEGQFPHPKAIQEPAELEEERRLFYVAVTRTKKELYLTYPLTRTSYEKGQVLMRPSQFIQELPEDHFELWRVGENRPSSEELELPL